MARVVVPGRFPGLNEYVRAERANRYRAADMKRRETERVRLAALSQSAPPLQCSRPAVVSIAWYEPNARRDVDNVAFAAKFVLDGLVAAKVLPGDSRRYVSEVRSVVLTDRERPRVEVEVVEP